MRALILVAAAGLAVSACDDDRQAPNQNIVVVDENSAVARDFQRCSNGDLIPIDQTCPPRNTPPS